MTGAAMGLTTSRCWSCLGGSMAMNIGMRKSSRWSRMVIPPRLEADENTVWFASPCMMSL